MYCRNISIDQVLSPDINIVSSIVNNISSKLVSNFYLSDIKMHMKKYFWKWKMNAIIFLYIHDYLVMTLLKWHMFI